MKQVRQFFLFGMLFFAFSCTEKDRKAAEIDKISVALKVYRFDKEFLKTGPKGLPELKLKYPELFPTTVPDSIWIAKMEDTLQQELQTEINKVFGDFNKETEALRSLFQHIRFYFPTYKVPKVVTLTSDVQYAQRVVLTDTLLLIGLDNYLGKEHRFYRSFPKYISKGLRKSFLISDVGSVFTKTVNPYPKNRTLLARMIHYGKALYLKDLLTPNLSDSQKIGYENEELTWAQANEQQMWRYFVERDLLYSTDATLDRRFLDPAPFSKFGLELDRESPGRLGRYIGWQIVRAFMAKNPKVSVMELLDLPAEDLFKKSNYKPKK
ncbi:MAG: gliding motility lipoprotein GldB [Bacteroidota bacterium]